MKSAFRFLSMLGLGILLTSNTNAGPPAKIDQLGFLTGNWIGKFGTGDIEENWLAPEGGSIIAMVRVRPNPETTNLYEMVLIEEEGDSLVLNVKQFGSGMRLGDSAPQKMELIEITENSVYFRDPERRGFSTIRYTRVDQESFRIEIVRADDTVIDIPMKARSIWR